MKRNIIATIKLAHSTITLTVLERLSSSIVELFNDQGELTKAASFLSQALKRVSALIGASLTHVSVVIEPAAVVQAKITLDESKQRLGADVVVQQDIDYVIDSIRRKFTSPEVTPILVQPLSFAVYDAHGLTKKYSRAPLAKAGLYIEVTSAVTTIANAAYDFIISAIKSQRLEISQILLSPQAVAQNHLSPNALAAGAVHLHVTDSQSFMTINKNTATLAQLTLYTYGFKELVAGVVKVFGCSETEARNLLAVYAVIDGDESKVIYTRQNGLNEEFYTSADLSAIIVAFLQRLASGLKQYLAQKQVVNLPIVISGKVWKIAGVVNFFKDQTQAEYVSLYNPLSFVEMNEQNSEALGMLKFMLNIDEVLGNRFQTVIETNPNTLSSLRMPSTDRRWYWKVLGKIGGHYDWK